MNLELSHNYNRIAKAIAFIQQHHTQQPSLEQIAEQVQLSPFHFQRLFIDWAGVSPKKFLQFLSVEHAKKLLKTKELSLFDTAHETGLSGTGRLHDLFVNIEAMTPGEYKSGGEGLHIRFHFAETRFGNMLIASTDKGVCRMVFVEDETNALLELKGQFPKADFEQARDEFQHQALKIFELNWSDLPQIKLHLKGTGFQLKVWHCLLSIPFAELNSYGKIAVKIGNPRASRAVGTAIGENPIAFLIPCHRVVQANGSYGEYRWGSTRKKILIGWEALQKEQLSHDLRR